MAAEKKRVQGSVFAIEALPCLTGKLDTGLKFCLIQVNQNKPFKNYANYISSSSPRLYYGLSLKILIEDLKQYDHIYHSYFLKIVNSEMTDSNFEDLHNIYNINWMEYYKSKAVGVNYYLEWHKHRKIKAYSLDSLIQISKEFRDTKIIFDLQEVNNSIRSKKK